MVSAFRFKPAQAFVLSFGIVPRRRNSVLS